MTASFPVVPGDGTILRVRNEADDAWIVVGGIVSLGIDGGSVETIDDTDLSHDGFREFLVGLKEEGNLSITINHKFDDVGQTRLWELAESQAKGGSSVAMEVEVPDVEYQKEFDGVVLEFPFDGSEGLAGKLVGTIVIAIDGDIVDEDLSD